MKILVINGPNMNLLGVREPEIYGRATYSYLTDKIEAHAKKLGIDVECIQTNHEGEIIDHIQRAFFEKMDGIIINPAGYTHTSVAIGDAISGTSVPVVEVHISDINNREEFRKINFVKGSCIKSYIGMGLDGYIAAMDFLYNYTKNES